MTDKIPNLTKLGMIFGVVGLLFVLAPIMAMSVGCEHNKNVTDTNFRKYDGKYDACIPVSKLMAALSSLMVAPILWASATG